MSTNEQTLKELYETKQKAEAAIAALEPEPSTIVESSLVTITLRALPITAISAFSKVIPSSSLITSPPVKISDLYRT